MCRQCGRLWPHEGDCPAKGKKCMNAGQDIPMVDQDTTVKIQESTDRIITTSV